MFVNGSDQEIQIRLNSEHGKFYYLVKQNSVPYLDVNNSYEQKLGQWQGHEVNNVVIKQENVIPNNSPLGQMTNFYIRVYPVVEPGGGSSAFTFTLAFYDDAQYVQLQDGYPIRGVATNQSMDYYFFDIPDAT